MSPKFMLVNRKLFLVMLFLMVLSAALQFGRIIINATSATPRAQKNDPRFERACGHVATQLRLADAWAQHPDSAHDAEIMRGTLEGVRAICAESEMQPAKPMKLAP